MADYDFRNPAFYYESANKDGNKPWLLVRFENHWFNIIDLGSILNKHKSICPYEDLQLRWVYPSPPQKLILSRYKTVLKDLNYDRWLNDILPNFEQISESCHCHQDFPNEPRVSNHVISGNLAGLIQDELLLDRLMRGPDFRECHSTSFEQAYTALEDALFELSSMHEAPRAEHIQWSEKLLKSFRHMQRLYARSTPARKQAEDLQPVKGRLADRKQELDAFCLKYTFLVADKSRGNFVIVCNNL